MRSLSRQEGPRKLQFPAGAAAVRFLSCAVQVLRIKSSREDSGRKKMAATRLWHRTGRLLEIASAFGPWPGVYSTSPAFAEVLRMPQKQLRKVVYPLRELEQHLVTDSRPGLIEQRLFDPSLEDIGRAESVFAATVRNRIEYLSSAVRLDHAPSLRQPEVRLTGLSTVGARA